MLFIVTRVTRLANLLAVVVMLVLAWPANAMIVSPLTLDLTSSGANNKATLTVTNDSAAEIPVEIVISRISINEKGETKEEPVKGSFLVFPSQQRIPAGGGSLFGFNGLAPPT